MWLCIQNPPRWHQFHVAPAMPALQVHHFSGYLKTRYKNRCHSCRITFERSESAREQRIALYESDQQSTTHAHRTTLASHRPLSNRHFNYWSINTSMPVFFIKSMTILAVGALSALHCLCCWVCVASFERWLTPLCVDCAQALINSLVCWLCTSAD